MTHRIKYGKPLGATTWKLLSYIHCRTHVGRQSYIYLSIRFYNATLIKQDMILIEDNGRLIRHSNLPF